MTTYVCCILLRITGWAIKIQVEQLAHAGFKNSKQPFPHRDDAHGAWVARSSHGDHVAHHTFIFITPIKFGVSPLWSLPLAKVLEKVKLGVDFHIFVARAAGEDANPA